MSKVSGKKKEFLYSEDKLIPKIEEAGSDEENEGIKSEENKEEIKEAAENSCMLENPFNDQLEEPEPTEKIFDNIEQPDNSIPEEKKSDEDHKYEDEIVPENVEPPEEVKASELPKEKDRAYKKVVDITNDELKLREYIINSKGVKAFLTSLIPDKAMKIGINYPNYDGNGNYFNIIENILKDASFKHVFRREDKNIKKFDYLIDLFTLDDKIRNHGILKRVCLVKVVR